MTDATKLYKGAAALRKGIAMFAWLGDVEAALKEVPELEKTLDTLREELAQAASEVDHVKTDLRMLRGEHTGAKAQAEKIISDAKERGAFINRAAEAKASAEEAVSQAELVTLRETIEKESADHLGQISDYIKRRDAVATHLGELNIELASIKARL